MIILIALNARVTEATLADEAEREGKIVLLRSLCAEREGNLCSTHHSILGHALPTIWECFG